MRYILQTLQAAQAMGAGRIVIHAGSCGKITREQALELAKDTMRAAIREADSAGYGNIRMCVETMGKVGQLGTLDEVLELCRLDERLLPCIDFGHLNARTFGNVRTSEQVNRVFESMRDRLGEARMKQFHSHFSKIEYTQKGGEKVHLTFADTIYGPEFEPVAELTVRYGCSPVFICESAGTQAEDARVMKGLYQKAMGEQPL